MLLSLSQTLSLLTMKAFRYRTFELLWFCLFCGSVTIATPSDGSVPLLGGRDTVPKMLAYIHQGSGRTFVIQWAIENGIPKLKYRHDQTKSTLHHACPWRLLTAQHGFPEQSALSLPIPLNSVCLCKTLLAPEKC